MTIKGSLMLEQNKVCSSINTKALKASAFTTVLATLNSKAKLLHLPANFRLS